MNTMGWVEASVSMAKEKRGSSNATTVEWDKREWVMSRVRIVDMV